MAILVDYDLLHANFEGKLKGPRTGKTYAQCATLANHLLSGHDKVFVICNDSNEILSLYPTVLHWLEIMEVVVLEKRRNRIATDSMFYTISSK